MGSCTNESSLALCFSIATLYIAPSCYAQHVLLSEHLATVKAITRLPDSRRVVVGENAAQQATVLTIGQENGIDGENQLSPLEGDSFAKVFGISPDGEFVTGLSGTSKATLWNRTPPATPIDLGDLREGRSGDVASAVSNNGTVVGFALNLPFQSFPFLWSHPDGPMRALPFPPCRDDVFPSNKVNAISADGSVAIGELFRNENNNCVLTATKWAGASDPVFFDDVIVGRRTTLSKASDISPNGNITVGVIQSNDLDPDVDDRRNFAAVWVGDMPPRLITSQASSDDLPVDGATGVTDDGFVVGTMVLPAAGGDPDEIITTPFIWNESFPDTVVFDTWLASKNISLPGPSKEIHAVHSNAEILDFGVELMDSSLHLVSVPLNIPPMMPSSDFNEDGQITEADLDSLCSSFDSNDLMRFDLNLDGSINLADVTLFLSKQNTEYGDANLDGLVEFGDFLRLSANFDRPGFWSTGDFDCDGEVKFPDFLRLSSNFNFGVSGSNAASASVPEPPKTGITAPALLGIFILQRRRRSARGGPVGWAEIKPAPGFDSAADP